MKDRTKGFFFAKQQRLSSNQQIRAVLSQRKSVGNGFFRLYCAENQLSHPRFAVSVNSRFANAVLRNRLKRISREVFRLTQHNLSQSCDYLLIIPDNLTKKRIGKRLKNKSSITFEKMLNDFTAANTKLLNSAERNKK